jgi:hypothetical protein
MIDLRETKIRAGSDEVRFSEQLNNAGINWRFGEIRLANGERHASTFLVNNKFAISFSRFSPTIEAGLATNKFKPQVWSKADVRWRQRKLNQQLSLYR